MINEKGQVIKNNSPEGIYLKWWKELCAVKESRQRKRFEKAGDKILKIYASESDVEAAGSQSTSKVMYNVLWSNIQVLKPAVFSRIPKIVCERRFKDSDPIGRMACSIVERSTSFMISVQEDRFFDAVSMAVDDCLLPGLGNVWLRYEAKFDTDAQDSTVSLDDSNPDSETQEFITPGSERVIIDPLNWKDYFESPARHQYEVRWKAKRVYMTRQELVERFGDIGNEVVLTHDPMKGKGESEDFLKQAEVFEIQDLQKKQRIWISEGYKKAPLEIAEDTLGIEGFFSCPKPLTATTRTDSNYPIADFLIYEKLAEEVDYVTKRIAALVECVRFVGASSAAMNAELKDVLSLRDGQVMPLQNWVNFTEKGGFGGAIDWLPFERAVQALEPLMAYRDDCLIKIDLITGLPDIARGVTDPSETASAQQRKSRWATIKLSERQSKVQRFCRQIISIMAQIIFEPGLFTDESIALMCGVAQMSPSDQELFYPALEMLKNDRLRTFRVTIETDSTIATDEEEDRASRMEYISAVQSLISNIQNVSQFRPELMKPMIESALFTIRAFRTGRPLEGAWEKAMQEIEENDAAAKESPPPPDYEQMKLEMEGQKLQMDAQIQAQKLELDNQKLQSDIMINNIKAELEQRKLALDEFLKPQELQMEGEKNGADFNIESQKLQLEANKMQESSAIEAMTLELERFKHEYSQFIQAKTLELEQYRVVVSEKEKLLTEQRLQEEKLEKERERNQSEANRLQDNDREERRLTFEMAKAEREFRERERDREHEKEKRTQEQQKKKSKKKIVVTRTENGLEGTAEDSDD
jgi:hypothetical protein